MRSRNSSQTSFTSGIWLASAAWVWWAACTTCAFPGSGTWEIAFRGCCAVRTNRLCPSWPRNSAGKFKVIICRSAGAVQEIEAVGVRLNGVVDTTPNWILGEQPPLREHYYSQGEVLRIVSAGQMGRHKSIDLLIEAAALLKERGYDNFVIDLYGKVTDPTVAPLPRQFGVEDRVRFRGVCPQEELVRRYASHEYDVFAFPTWEREPFGCAPLEAAAYGCVMAITQSCCFGV